MNLEATVRKSGVAGEERMDEEVAGVDGSSAGGVGASTEEVEVPEDAEVVDPEALAAGVVEDGAGVTKVEEAGLVAEDCAEDVAADEDLAAGRTAVESVVAAAKEEVTPEVVGVDVVTAVVEGFEESELADIVWAFLSGVLVLSYCSSDSSTELAEVSWAQEPW